MRKIVKNQWKLAKKIDKKQGKKFTNTITNHEKLLKNIWKSSKNWVGFW